MTDAITTERKAFKCSCDFDAGSAYALKKHKRRCQYGLPVASLANGTPTIRAPFNGAYGTTAKVQGFTETYVKASQGRERE